MTTLSDMLRADALLLAMMASGETPLRRPELERIATELARAAAAIDTAAALAAEATWRAARKQGKG